MRVLLLSGPNLSRLGVRQPEIYGKATLEDLARLARDEADVSKIDLDHFESSSESELVDAVNKARDSYDGIIVNAAALTHYSWSLRDALASYPGKVVELHISNPLARERWRHRSVVSDVADGVISGFGSVGYPLAVAAISRLLERG